MRLVEHFRIFHVDSHQMVDVEKTAIIDLMSGGAPVGKPVNLFFQQLMQGVETFWMALSSIEYFQVGLNMLTDTRGFVP